MPSSRWETENTMAFLDMPCFIILCLEILPFFSFSLTHLLHIYYNFWCVLMGLLCVCICIYICYLCFFFDSFFVCFVLFWFVYFYFIFYYFIIIVRCLFVL